MGTSGTYFPSFRVFAFTPFLPGGNEMGDISGKIRWRKEEGNGANPDWKCSLGSLLGIVHHKGRRDWGVPKSGLNEEGCADYVQQINPTG